MLIRDIAQYLQANNIGTLGADIFLGDRPDQPDSLVALFPTGGYQQDLPLADVKATVQIVVRNKGFQSGYEGVWQIFSLLDGGEGRFIQLPGGRKIVARAQQPPLFLERDMSDRSIFVFNLSVVTGRD